MRSFKKRSEEEELMDDLSCSGEVVDQTLRELDIINRKLGGNFLSVQGLRSLTTHLTDHEPLVIADLGCGGGDIMILMAKWLRKKGIKAQFIGIDANPNIIRYAEEHCKAFPEISFRCLDIFGDEFQSLQFDIVHSSLFTHHFTQSQLITLFSQLKQQSNVGIIINDLHRHWLAYYSIKLITRLFSRSAMVRNDAAVSVARGFRRHEIRDVLIKSDLANFQINWKWAFRWKVVIRV
ncbi:MAG: methyltransferase domain-containing protein [Bacteroidota bacterium]